MLFTLFHTYHIIVVIILKKTKLAVDFGLVALNFMYFSSI